MSYKTSCYHASTTPATVSVSALSSGHFSLPEYQFVHPISHEARRTVPSLAFLIEHMNHSTCEKTRIVFDLGLRRDPKRYAIPIQKHIESRQPMSTLPDVTESLARGGLGPDDIDYIIFSHVHWDHIGEPRDFPNSNFVVGHGSLSLLNGNSTSLRGGHSFFEKDLLPPDRTIELSKAGTHDLEKSDSGTMPGQVNFNGPWRLHGHLPETMDIFNDGSILIVNAPGHLPGHINLLVHMPSDSTIYLAGDACHDRRLLTGEKSIGEWHDDGGNSCCIHADRKQAEQTIARIRKLEEEGVEVILAHDDNWERKCENQDRFFGRS